MIDDVIRTTLESFDFTFCISVNILTYMIIKVLTELKLKIKVTTWFKRIILVIVCLIMAIIYYLIGQDMKLIINSAILAPVAWSWIFRPICEKFKLTQIKDDVLDL